MINDFARCIAIVIAVVLIACAPAVGQQIADPGFNVRVDNPSYTKNFPRVLFDEAHNNFHTSTGRYKPFADLIFSDGYQVNVNRKPFSKESLQTHKVLIIANALGAEEMDEEGAAQSAFTEAEVKAVHDWVRGGGALLLIADHAPFGGAAETLAKAFDVTMSKGYVRDPEHSDPDAPGLIIFSRENKLLLDHPITTGRDDGERINRVFTFTGQALKGPAGSVDFMKLGPAAMDRPSATATESVPVGGQGQGIAFKFGKGRVVMMGEAAMLSAQLAGPQKRRMGMNVPGSDNRQLALNIMHWLSGLLK